MPVASRWTMRYLPLLIVLTALPETAAAQHSPSLPSIGLPLPSIGLPPERSTPRPWDGRPHVPWWENQGPPPWEKGHVGRRVNIDVDRRGQRNDFDGRGNRNNARVVYVLQPYPVAVQQEPQIIVVQQPPVTRIVQVEVPAPEPRVEPAPRPAEPEPPPFVPTGDRTLYVIPGCYVGNVPPKDVKLPAHCDLKKVTTYVP
jgi:hypothetical protein